MNGWMLTVAMRVRGEWVCALVSSAQGRALLCATQVLSATIPRGMRFCDGYIDTRLHPNNLSLALLRNGIGAAGVSRVRSLMERI